MNQKSLACMFDHTNLKPTATPAQIKQTCEEAVKIGAASVCVNSCNVKLTSECLKGSGVMTGCTIGFPLGANTPETKAFETKQAIQNGAEEVDMVINIGALLADDYDTVKTDIEKVIEAADGTPVKVIIETCYLNDEQKQEACKIAASAGASFVKTSTGFGTGGALPEDVRLMKQSVPDNVKVKASGGMHTWEDAKKEIEAGADRLGVSASLEILRTFKESEDVR